MGEYVKYRGKEVKIGTLENLYYSSFGKYISVLNSGALKNCPGSEDPHNYVLPDTDNRFRFPFPDEEKLPFGQIIEPFDRGVPIKINSLQIPTESKQSFIDGTVFYEVEIFQQRLVHRQSDEKLCLALVLREKGIGLYRIEDDTAIKDIISQIVKNNILPAADLVQKNFYRKIASQILKGYRMKLGPTQKIQSGTKISGKDKPSQKRNRFKM
ncbi:hypothetical protein [Chitinophaga hostae]|uniref:hypothetical protein n=1 Tax=Chitinophaga hostae TaxID=2831022 RepID=UPI003F69E1D2